MQILNVIQGTNLGGMEQASLSLMKDLMRRGHSFRLLSLNPVGPLGPLLEEAGIPHEGIPYQGRGGWRSFLKLRGKLHESQGDALLMTGHNLLAMLGLGGLCRGRRLLAIHFHHTGVRPAWQWRLIYRVAYNRFQAIVFPCDFIRREAEELFPQIRKISHVIRNPVPLPEAPTDEERNLARQSFGLGEEALVVGNAGWLIPRKRFDVFLRVAALISQKDPRIRFVVAGDGPEKQRLEILAESLGLREKVVWLGWQKDLRPFYLSLDTLLFNSDWDAMGMTPLEAMSYRVPVVASVRNGGLKEVMEDGQGGFCLDEHDVERLADRVVALLENPEARREYGEVGRRRISEVGSVQTCVDLYEKLLLGEDAECAR